MKFLNEYTNVLKSEVMKKFGAFSAFSKDKKDLKQPNIKYVRCGDGYYVPKANATLLINAMKEAHLKAIAQDVAENGKDAIIRRELYNHEAIYTWDIESTFDCVKPYGYTEQDVQNVFEVIKKERKFNF